MTRIDPTSDTAIEMKRIAEALISQKDDLIKNLSKHRREEVRTKSALEKATIELGELEDGMARMHRNKTYEIVAGPEWKENGSDPRDPDGRTSQSWAEMYVERMLRHDQEWNDMLKAFYDKQKEAADLKEKALESQASVMTFQEMLMSNGQEMRLRAAMWQASIPTNINIETKEDV